MSTGGIAGNLGKVGNSQNLVVEALSIGKYDTPVDQELFLTEKWATMMPVWSVGVSLRKDARTVRGTTRVNDSVYHLGPRVSGEGGHHPGRG